MIGRPASTELPPKPSVSTHLAGISSPFCIMELCTFPFSWNKSTSIKHHQQIPCESLYSSYIRWTEAYNIWPQYMLLLYMYMSSDISLGNMNKPLFAPDREPRTDQVRIQPKPGLANQWIIWITFRRRVRDSSSIRDDSGSWATEKPTLAWVRAHNAWLQVAQLVSILLPTVIAALPNPGEGFVDLANFDNW